jgi:hypothetical protein
MENETANKAYEALEKKLYSFDEVIDAINQVTNGLSNLFEEEAKRLKDLGESRTPAQNAAMETYLMCANACIKSGTRKMSMVAPMVFQIRLEIPNRADEL